MYNISKKSPPQTISYELGEKFGSATADWVDGDNGYTVTMNGFITREKMPVQKAMRAKELLDQGEPARASLILSPIL